MSSLENYNQGNKTAIKVSWDATVNNQDTQGLRHMEPGITYHIYYHTYSCIQLQQPDDTTFLLK